MKKVVYIAVAAALAFGCAKESGNIEPGTFSDGFCIKVNVEQTKTVFDGEEYTVEWEADDALGVYIVPDGQAGSLYKFTRTSEENTFACVGFSPEENVDYTYYVLYPYSENFSVSDGKSNEVVEIPSGTQQSAADDASHIKTPLYGMASATGTASPEVLLGHLATVIKINIENYSNDAISNVSLERSNDDEPLTGTFSVNFETGELTASEVSPTAEITVSDGISGAYFIACSPFATTDGETLTVKVNDGVWSAVKSGLDFAAGKVYSTTLVCSDYVLGGTAVPEGANPVMTPTLENGNVYAWRAELQAGELVISTPEGYVASSDKYFTEKYFYTFSENASETSWTISTNGIYRIVIDTVEKTIVIYNPENDLIPKYANGTWADGSLAGYGKNPAENTVEVECLWMYGPFNSFVDKSGVKQGFDFKYRCLRSLADPYIFVYSGDELPRISGNANAGSAKKWTTGAMVFFIGPEKPLDGSAEFSSSSSALPRPYNNSYAFGSADANSVRNSVCQSIETSLDIPYNLREGQDDSRYDYFEIPEGCNYVLVNLRAMTVEFSRK